MNVVFMGTPEFAIPALWVLAQHPKYDVRAIFTRLDAISKRGMVLTPSPVKTTAEQLGLSALVHTPRSLYARDEQDNPLPPINGVRALDADVLAVFKQAAADFIVVAAYGLILPPAILALPRHACINIHASLLPRWRGAAPIQRALLAGDEKLGVSIMRIEEGLDTGPYCATVSTFANDKNATELTSELAQLGAQLLIDVLPDIATNTARWVEQDETKATYADKLVKHELALNSADLVITNLRRVRASSSQAPARCHVAGRSVTVLAARIPTTDEQQDPRRLLFACQDGNLEITELKPDGKRAMSASAFLSGL